MDILRALLIPSSLFALMLSLNAFATVQDTCNGGGNGIPQIQEHASDVAVTTAGRSRIANNGIGNGGESVDVTIEATTGEVTDVSCVSTADEETGGDVTLTINGSPVITIPGAVDELDPGYDPQP